MAQSVLDGLLLVLQPESFLYLTIGMAIGLVIGFLPGLGGLATLALLTPLIIGMDPAPGLAFILGAYGAVSFGGSITAILFNVPGTGEQVVTTFDGYPMARKGQAGRALGVSAAASAFGGLFGVVVLVLAIPVALQLMTYIRSPEIFVLGMLGILVIGITDADTRLKGVISGALGLMLSFIGLDPITGISRMTFGNLELLDGLSITAITMGLFALAEMFAIYTRGVSIAGNMPTSRSREKGARVVDGVMDGVRNWRKVLQGGTIGALSGVVPGVGGTIGMFGAYALAKKTSKDPDSFGKGNPVGVLAPESANNAKEGGSFVPTLAFGVPGSSGMALVIVILLIMGFTPGPDLINNHLDIVFLIAWVMALSNILCSVLGIAVAPALSKLAFLRPQLLAPTLIAISLIGSFLDSRLALGIVVALVFGVVGYLFKATGYSAAGVTLGFVLGPLIDQNLGLSLQVFGPGFLLRPIPIVLGTIVVLLLLWPTVKGLVRRRRTPEVPGGSGEPTVASRELADEETRRLTP